MAYYYRPRYYRNNYRRRRYFRRWRPRRFIRRRFRRRKWVRNFKRKLSKITVKEYQPVKIRKLHIKGLYPCFLATHARLSNNLPQWIDSIAPEHFPGGGGFSILQFTLNGLYELFLKGQNWWTQTNCQLPLIRYNGVSLKFYKAEMYDYVVNIIRCYPMKSTDLLYMNTQPSIMMMNKKGILIPCRKSNRLKKPYRKIFVKPPAQMQTHWYFQQHFSNIPLLIIIITACSFDRYYTASTAQSTTIGFTSLNTTTFQFHNWKKFPTSGYKPQENLWLYGLKHEADPNNPKVEDLVYLGNTKPLTEGKSIKEVTTGSQTVENYFTNENNWGNIFDPNYLAGENPIYSTNKSTVELKTILSTTTERQKKLSESQYFTKRTIGTLTNCRYNPLKDKGKGNKIMLISNTSDINTWHEPTNPKLMRQDLPLWILTWGWLDWQKKLAEVQLIDNEYMTVIVSPYIEPFLHYYLVLDQNFLNITKPTSPYLEYLTDGDAKNFHPKNAFQLKTINEIATCGPGVIKLQQDQSCEAHFKYNFHFKLGGCPPPMDSICDPSKEPIYPIPDTKSNTTSLQSPGTSISTYLYNFDERQGFLTEAAAKRITQDKETEKTIFPFTGTAMDLQPSPAKVQIWDSETSEEEEEKSLFQQLKHLHKQQRDLKRGIKQLIQNLK
nr:MAG: ORF1 [TTV-like mini virus]